MKLTLTPLVAALAASLAWSVAADAQVRARGRVRVVTPRTSIGVYVGRPYYYRPIYRPFYYDPFYRPYFYRPFYWYPYPAAAYGYGGFDGGASLRVQVMPRDTEVYIDNYYAGTVDDFDGMFQRLHLDPGAHDVTLWREGYRTVRQRIYIQPTGTFRLRYNMVPLAPGEVPEPRPAEPPRPQGPPAQGAPNQYPPYPPQGQPYPPQRGGPPYPSAPPSAPEPGAGAAIAVRVQPANADVFIDGERWEGPTGDERLVIQVAPGPHHIEVRRDGYRTYATDVNARAGDTATLNISLSRQQ